MSSATTCLLLLKKRPSKPKSVRIELRNSPNNTMDSDDKARELAQIRLDDAKEISFANTAVPWQTEMSNAGGFYVVLEARTLLNGDQLRIVLSRPFCFVSDSLLTDSLHSQNVKLLSQSFTPPSTLVISAPNLPHLSSSSSISFDILYHTCNHRQQSPTFSLDSYLHHLLILYNMHAHPHIRTKSHKAFPVSA